MYMWRPEMFSLFSQVTQSFWKEEEARLKFWTHQLWLQWLFIFHALHIFDLKKKCPGGFIVVNKGPKNIKITKQKERTRSTSGYERVIQSSDQFFFPLNINNSIQPRTKENSHFFFFLRVEETVQVLSTGGSGHFSCSPPGSTSWSGCCWCPACSAGGSGSGSPGCSAPLQPNLGELNTSWLSETLQENAVLKMKNFFFPVV